MLLSSPVLPCTALSSPVLPLYCPHLDNIQDLLGCHVVNGDDASQLPQQDLLATAAQHGHPRGAVHHQILLPLLRARCTAQNTVDNREREREGCTRPAPLSCMMCSSTKHAVGGDKGNAGPLWGTQGCSLMATRNMERLCLCESATTPHELQPDGGTSDPSLPM
jgi:hypothetical protein